MTKRILDSSHLTFWAEGSILEKPPKVDGLYEPWVLRVPTGTDMLASIALESITDYPPSFIIVADGFDAKDNSMAAWTTRFWVRQSGLGGIPIIVPFRGRNRQQRERFLEYCYTENFVAGFPRWMYDESRPLPMSRLEVLRQLRTYIEGFGNWQYAMFGAKVLDDRLMDDEPEVQSLVDTLIDSTKSYWEVFEEDGECAAGKPDSGPVGRTIGAIAERAYGEDREVARVRPQEPGESGGPEEADTSNDEGV